MQGKEQEHSQKQKNNPQAGFSAQENKIVNDLLETKVVLGPADLVPEY